MMPWRMPLVHVKHKIRRTDAEVEAPKPPDAKRQLIGKDSDARKD